MYAVQSGPSLTRLWSLQPPVRWPTVPPRNQTHRRKGVRTGAFLLSYHDVGSAPRVRLITNQTVEAGWFSVHRGTR